MANHIFLDRKQAGRRLASKLSVLAADQFNTLVLALPRGGVPVAFEVAQALDLKLDVLIVRKIGHPQHPEYGIGAVTEDGTYHIDPDAVGTTGIATEQLNKVIEKEKQEVHRRIKLYRDGAPLPSVKGKTVILIDDGLATGVTARMAARFLKAQGAKRIVLAVAVCSHSTANWVRTEVDYVICCEEPTLFTSVGEFYKHFEQVSDADVVELLSIARNGVGNAQAAEEVIVKNAMPMLKHADLTPVVEKLSESRIVMLGESTHGTQEFYHLRRLISQDLIANHGFKFIAVEGDWPPCAELNLFIHSQEPKKGVKDVLTGFHRWPTWMWANTEVMKLILWMKKYNQGKTADEQASFHGLDVYSLFESMDEALMQLKKIDRSLAHRVRMLYECFDPYQRDERAYIKSLTQFPWGCEAQVIEALQDILRTRLENTQGSESNLFDAAQNARIARNAERYYRAMIHGDEDSWNIRDHHMTETLKQLLDHHGPTAKAIVWAHNTHIGDYRATDMVSAGQVNIGGLAREHWGEDKVSLIGFGTYQGKVTASHAWDGPVEEMTVPPGRPQSYEALCHEASLRLGWGSYFLWLKSLKHRGLSQIKGHRAIGVVYHPQSKRMGNYVPTSLSRRYDGFVFVDQTNALTPLKQAFLRKEIPETWPQGV